MRETEVWGRKTRKSGLEMRRPDRQEEEDPDPAVGCN